MMRFVKFALLAVVTVAAGLIVLSYIPGANTLIASLSKKAA